MIKSESIQMVEAFWISPKGEIIEVPDKHILTVISDPSKFGITIKDIDAEYRGEKEEMGSEKNARLKIIKRLVGNGWIRLRFHPRSALWTANVPAINERNKRHLIRWANHMLKISPKKFTLCDVVNIDALDKRISITINDIAREFG